MDSDDIAFGSIQGGAGTDRIVIANYSTGVNLDLGTSSIENVNTNSNNVNGAPGDDNFDASTQTNAVGIYAGNGDDTLIGSDLNDTLDGQHGDDTISGGDGNDNITGGGGADTLIGGDGTDVFNLSLIHI